VTATLSTPAGGDLEEGVRQLLDEARRNGDPEPGRPTLAKLLGATEHQVRQVLARVRQEVDEAPTAQLSVVPAEPLVEAAGDALAEAGDTAGDAGDQQPPGRPTSARLPRPWPLAFIAMAGAVAVWGGWVRLGELTGFGPINLLPGIGNGLVINTAVVLPLSVEFYAAYALRVLLASGELSERTKRFARWSFAASLAVGGAAQVASHVMGAAGVTAAPWWVTTAVACVPVMVVGLATGLATLVRQDDSTGGE